MGALFVLYLVLFALSFIIGNIVVTTGDNYSIVHYLRSKTLKHFPHWA